MKKLLILLLLLPPGVYAQEGKPDSAVSKPMKWEIGVNTAIAFTTQRGFGGIYDDRFLVGRNSLSIYRNFTEGQIGLVAEGGLLGVGDGWYISPHVVANYKMPFKRFYGYFGGAAGYVREETTDRVYARLDLRGFLMGIQGGVVYGIGQRFALNAECGVRIKDITSVEIMYDYVPPPTDIMPRGYTDVYFPVSVGVRYRF
ncbi:MAG: hypothetical protein K0R82_805 [Flavipsychrobacter sp.]|nr:hypothetical protein [Flavipsychrobacter sp.]